MAETTTQSHTSALVNVRIEVEPNRLLHTSPEILAAAAASAEGMSDEYKKLGEQVIREMPMKSLLGQMPGEQVEQLIGQLNCLLAQ